jgi:hypothetical protein
MLVESEESMAAARITVKDDEDPTITCVLEILLYLAGLPSVLDELNDCGDCDCEDCD